MRSLHWQGGIVLTLSLLITAALTVTSAVSYANNERSLTALQTRLTASVLQTAQPQLQAILGRVIGLTAAARSPAATFRSAITGELTPAGPFASATLAVVADGQVRVLDHVGSAPIQGLTSTATTELFLEAARSTSLLTTRAVAPGEQKLGYLLSARGPAGMYVVGASQELAEGAHIKVPAGSADSNLNFALYFGSTIKPANLIESNVGRLPLTGTVSKATVPFGNNVLTLVASPRDSLAGAWAEYLPWGILGLGILLSVAAGAAVENLTRRRTTAEALYRQQRNVSETLQHALLPRRLPTVAGWQFAARYLPATHGAEIGGDWYSVVEIDDHRFALVVGDVSGHDIAAAGVMGALRYSIRTLARLGIPPDEVLDRTRTEIDVTTDDHFATALVGVIDIRTNELILASAGHLPPLMIDRRGARFIDVVPGVPLGVRGAPRPRPVAVHLSPGSTLVAFTDGLIEQRNQSLDAGLSDLLAAATAASGLEQPDELITHLVTTLTAHGQEDDIAVLAVRFSGLPAPPGTEGPQSPAVRDPGPPGRIERLPM
jgi:serine phosphatase RsbU (regulator of sigma subunit)